MCEAGLETNTAAFDVVLWESVGENATPFYRRRYNTTSGGSVTPTASRCGCQQLVEESVLRG